MCAVSAGNFSEHVFSAMKERDILRCEAAWHFFLRARTRSSRSYSWRAARGLRRSKRSSSTHSTWSCAVPDCCTGVGADRSISISRSCRNNWRGQHDHLRFVPVLSEALASDPVVRTHRARAPGELDDHPSLEAFQVYASGYR